MIYPKTDFCPFNADNPCGEVLPEREERMCPDENGQREVKNETGNALQAEMMKKIYETEFALTDLNLFLDTHPDCQEALNLFTQLAATLKSLKADYESQFGPLYAWSSKKETPFQWVEQGRKWPWEI